MTQTIAPRVRILVLLLLAVTGALLAGAAPASAHAALTGSDPGQGAVVDTAPTQVSLTFSEQIAVSDDAVRVLDPRGKRVDKGTPANPGGTTYTVRLLSGLPDGTYTVAYQVVSADSHPVAGAFTFSIGAPSETSVSASAPASDDGLIGGLYGIGRYVSYAGFVVMTGGAAFVLACWGRGAGVRAVQRLVVSGWLTLTAATLALLLLRGSYTTSGAVGDVFDLSLLGDVLQTKTGAALVSRLLLLAAAALFIAVLFGAYDKREAEEKQDLIFGLAIGGTVVAAGLAASWAMSEHASQGLQPGVAMPVDVLHLLAVAAWLGGLTTLLVALYRAPADTPVDRDAVQRFSRLAFGSVVALVVTGVYQSWRQLGSWSALTDTRYGQLLLAKIGLVVVMVATASVSRRWTARLVEAPVPAAHEEKKEEQPAGAGKAAEAGKGESGKDEPGAEKGGDARAAQLARQRAAMESARQKRLRDADPPPLRPAPLRTRRGGHRRRPARRHHRTDADRAGAHRAGGRGGHLRLVVRLDRPGHRRGNTEHALRHRRRERQGRRHDRPRPRPGRRQRHARLCGGPGRPGRRHPRGEGRLHPLRQGHRTAARRPRPHHHRTLVGEWSTDPHDGRLEGRGDRADLRHRPGDRLEEREDRLNHHG
ncbi:copper transport protein [Streptomyces sp. SAI-229]